MFPGYLWIEAVEWSETHRKWFIAPRYVSFEKYDEKLTEHRGANLLMIASEDFRNIELVWIEFDAVDVSHRDENRRRLLEDTGYKMMSDLNTAQLRGMSVKQENIKKHLQWSDLGFSSLAFVPNTNDSWLVGIRTNENNKQHMYSELTVFDVQGRVYLQSERAPLPHKYEGLVVL